VQHTKLTVSHQTEHSVTHCVTRHDKLHHSNTDESLYSSDTGLEWTTHRLTGYQHSWTDQQEGMQ